MDHFNSVKPCIFGPMAFNVNDMYVGKSLDKYGEFSMGEVAIFTVLLEPHGFIIDIGANIGAHTIYFSKINGSTVLAFEPQRLVFQLLCANIAINSIPNVYCYNEALGEEHGALVVPELDPTQTVNWGGLNIEGHEDGNAVPVSTLDDLADENGIPSCQLIKIDVEGMEEKVLRGGQKFIAKHRPILYVENDRKEKSSSLLSFISSLGYLIRDHRPTLYNPHNYRGDNENVFGRIVSENIVCIPKERPDIYEKIVPLTVA